jgi:hypothetical protein
LYSYYVVKNWKIKVGVYTVRKDGLFNILHNIQQAPQFLNPSYWIYFKAEKRPLRLILYLCEKRISY